VLWHASYREWTRLLWLAPLAAVSLAVAALWYAPLVHRLGGDFVGRELWLQNFDRFGTTTRGHGGKGALYYLESLFSDLGPWIFLLPAALVHAWRQRADRGLRLVFLTAASTKRNVYLLPAYPALLVLLSAWVSAHLNSRWLRGSLALTAALLALAAIGFGVWLHTPLAAQPRFSDLLPWLSTPSLALAVVFGGGALLIAAALRRGEAERAVRALSATLLVAFTAAMWLVMPAIDRVHNYAEPGAWVNATAAGREPVGFYAPGKETLKRAGWLCHIGTRRLEFLPDAAAAAAWLAAVPGRILLADPETAAPVQGARVVHAWRIGDQPWNAMMRDPAAPR
jgi:4-amino-4-deoxy-L-arabinose transferase-like glycosyltransferase